jgi:hypothetical protein
MPLNLKAGCVENEESTEQELEFLYKRLSTINNLIHSLEQYDRYRQGTDSLQTKKPA